MKVRVKHYRNGITHYRAYRALRNKGISHSAAWKYVQKYVSAPAFEDVSPTGGMTTVDVVLDSGLEFHGEAHCSMEDMFVRKTGEEIALSRVTSQMEEALFVLSVAYLLGELAGGRCLVVAI